MEYFRKDSPFSPSTPSYFSPTGRSSFLITMQVLAILSVAVHVLFLLGIRRLCGWGAQSAYIMLASISLSGAFFSLSYILCIFLTILGMKWSDCIPLWRISGGVFIAATLSMNFFNLFLLIQRGICIFLPFLTKRILSRTVVTVCTSAVFLFYLSVVAICVTPYFGAAFVPEHIVYAVLSELQYSIIVLRSNQFTNYVVMASNVIIYPILLIVLKCRKQFGNSAKQELRITTQIAITVLIQVIFFLVWEYNTFDGATKIVVYQITDLLYYNAITIPYFVFNRDIQQELRSLLFSPAPKSVSLHSAFESRASRK